MCWWLLITLPSVLLYLWARVTGTGLLHQWFRYIFIDVATLLSKNSATTHLHQPVLLLHLSKRGSFPGPCTLEGPRITNTQNSWFITDTCGISVTQQSHSITHNPHHLPLWLTSFSPQQNASLHLLLCLGSKGHLSLKVYGLCPCWHQKWTLLWNVGKNWTAQGLRLLKMSVSQDFDRKRILKRNSQKKKKLKGKKKQKTLQRNGLLSFLKTKQ